MIWIIGYFFLSEMIYRYLRPPKQLGQPKLELLKSLRREVVARFDNNLEMRAVLPRGEIIGSLRTKR